MTLMSEGNLAELLEMSTETPAPGLSLHQGTVRGLMAANVQVSLQKSQNVLSERSLRKREMAELFND